MGEAEEKIVELALSEALCKRLSGQSSLPFGACISRSELQTMGNFLQVDLFLDLC